MKDNNYIWVVGVVLVLIVGYLLVSNNNENSNESQVKGNLTRMLKQVYPSWTDESIEQSVNSYIKGIKEICEEIESPLIYQIGSYGTFDGMLIGCRCNNEFKTGDPLDYCVSNYILNEIQ